MNHQNKALNSAVINSMKLSDKDISDIGENRGLRVSCGKAGTKSFFINIRVLQNGRLP